MTKKTYIAAFVDYDCDGQNDMKPHIMGAYDTEDEAMSAVLDDIRENIVRYDNMSLDDAINTLAIHNEDYTSGCEWSVSELDIVI